jgi:hypothetical protein
MTEIDPHLTLFSDKAWFYAHREVSSRNLRLILEVAQAVSHWLPTAAARVHVWAARWVCGGQNGTEAGFLRVLQFPLPIIPPISPSS